jgi:hypothetical protein
MTAPGGTWSGRAVLGPGWTLSRGVVEITARTAIPRYSWRSTMGLGCEPRSQVVSSTVPDC